MIFRVILKTVVNLIMLYIGGHGARSGWWEISQMLSGLTSNVHVTFSHQNAQKNKIP